MERALWLPGALGIVSHCRCFILSREMQQKWCAYSFKWIDAVLYSICACRLILAGQGSTPNTRFPDAFSLYWGGRKTWKGILRTMFENVEQKRDVAYESVLKHTIWACLPTRTCLSENIHDADNLRLLPMGVDLQTLPPWDVTPTTDQYYTEYGL